MKIFTLTENFNVKVWKLKSKEKDKLITYYCYKYGNKILIQTKILVIRLCENLKPKCKQQ